MAKRNKKSQKDIEKWLLGFEEQVGSCVVSLLIDRGKINFIACYDKNKYFDIVDDSDEKPISDLKIRELQENTLSINYKNYIG